MTGPAFAFLFTILVSIGVLTVIGIGLAKQAMRLGKAGLRFIDEATPLVDEISSGAERASVHGAELAERLASLRSPRR